MKKLLMLSIGAAGVLLAANINATPGNFGKGLSAPAAKVKKKFEKIEQQIADNTADIQANSDDITTNANAIAAIPAVMIYDYRDFQADPAIGSKTFTTTGLCGDTEVRTIVQTPNGINTDVTVTRRRLMSATTCHLRDFSYVNTPTQRTLVASNLYSAIDETLRSTRAPVDPIVIGTTTMSKGGTIANGTRIDSTPVGGSPAYLGTLVDARVAVGLEDVSVAAGNYTGCLKISLIRQSGGFGIFQRVAWSCPGIGEVKRIQSYEGNYRMWELTSTGPVVQ